MFGPELFNGLSKPVVFTICVSLQGKSTKLATNKLEEGPMQILLITPGINTKYNDNAFSFLYLKKKGINIDVISNKLPGKLKGVVEEKEFENMNGIKINRIYKDFKGQTSIPVKNLRKVRSIVSKCRPDIIFCSQQKNMVIAKKISKEFEVPILLLVESAYDHNHPYKLIGRGKRKYIKNAKLANFIALQYWKWLCRHASSIITCNPHDIDKLEQLSFYGKKVYYVPWPSFPTYSKDISNHRNQCGVHIGALTEHKNIAEFKETLPLLLNRTPIEKFYFVGSGKDLYIINDLKLKYPGQVVHIPNLIRHEALELIANSYFGYSSAKNGAWGFIEDCWAMRTPIIVTTNHYKFKNKTDSLVTTKDKIEDAVNSLFRDHYLYKKLQEGGYQRFQNYSTDNQRKNNYNS
jgi:glycosyltransferase involved in cell wall biosynthesis